MKRKTQQVFTIIFCLVIFVLGILRDIAAVYADKISLIKLIFG